MPLFRQARYGCNFFVNRDDKVVSVPIKVEERLVHIKEEESQIAEVDGAVPGDDSLKSE